MNQDLIALLHACSVATLLDMKQHAQHAYALVDEDRMTEETLAAKASLNHALVAIITVLKSKGHNI